MIKAALETSIATWETWVQLFAVLVAIGIVGEVGVGVRLWILHKRLQSVQHAEDLSQEENIARLNKEAGDARNDAAHALERAAKAEENLGKANERAANAEKSAAESKLALEKIRLPRRLNGEQQARIAAKMRAFTGTQFDSALNSGEETQVLLGEIEDALKSAGWVQINWATDPTNLIFSRAGRPKAGVSSHTGVLIEIHPENAGTLQPIAKALVDALNSEGIVSEPKYVGGFINNNTNAIHVIVGEKPR